jgi:hypothetical protein
VPSPAHERAAQGQLWRHRSAGQVWLRRSDVIVGWFKRSGRTAQAGRKPSVRERRAAERTAQAETALQETEQRIHQLADQVRDDLKGSA